MSDGLVVQTLLGIRAELTDRLLRIRRDQQRADGPLPQDFEEQAQARENDDVIDRLEQVTASELAQVERAIRHAQAGEYGVCEVCGGGISAARLQAQPAATTCAVCADKDSGSS